MLTRRNLLAGASCAALASTTARAQQYPLDQPIRIVVGYAAGGGVDLVARMLQDPLKSALGQPIIVENRTGAAAMLAANTVAKAAPDGHTLLAAASGEVAINQHLYGAKMSYDPAKELVPIALIGIVPCVVVVNADSPIKDPKTLVVHAKANAGKLSFSSSGVGNPQQLAGELMNSMAGINVLHVPYRGSAPAVTDVATGAVTMSFSSLAAALPLIQAGKLRAVAVTSLDRMPQLPDVEPLQNGSPGLKGYELLNWFAMFGTGGTPQPVVDRLNGLITAAVTEKGNAEKLTAQGIVPRPMNASEFKRFVAAETEKFGKIVTAANIKLAN
jgi:tripartite-type tricarboxylate transporter receptor subunit TctC